MRTKYKAWAKPFIEEHNEITVSMETLETMSSYCLEIGSGKGKFLVDMAVKFPNTLFVGVERNVTCAGFTAKKIVEQELNNAKLIYENADNLFAHIKDKTIDILFLNFSDPWPKKRHAKRRLTYPKYLEEYYRVLKDDGKLIIKTDNDSLFEYTQETLSESKFKIEKCLADYVDYDEFDTPTEYELSFREKGQPIHKIVCIK